MTEGFHFGCGTARQQITARRSLATPALGRALTDCGGLRKIQRVYREIRASACLESASLGFVGGERVNSTATRGISARRVGDGLLPRGRS
jgi:hypothetical protein